MLFLLLAPPVDLTATIQALDTELFTAYNNCDLPKFASFLSEDLEFYHDQGGLSLGRQSTVDALQKNICGKVHRDLISSTLAVYPMNNFGAVQTGIHVFCDPKQLTPKGTCPDGSGVARFTHLWKNAEGAWKITRIISYDHCNSCSTSQPPEFRIPPKQQ